MLTAQFSRPQLQVEKPTPTPVSSRHRVRFTLADGYARLVAARLTNERSNACFSSAADAAAVCRRYQIYARRVAFVLLLHELLLLQIEPNVRSWRNKKFKQTHRERKLRTAGAHRPPDAVATRKRGERRAEHLEPISTSAQIVWIHKLRFFVVVSITVVSFLACKWCKPTNCNCLLNMILQMYSSIAVLFRRTIIICVYKRTPTAIATPVAKLIERITKINSVNELTTNGGRML